jgi:hypothetical protein
MDLRLLTERPAEPLTPAKLPWHLSLARLGPHPTLSQRDRGIGEPVGRQRRLRRSAKSWKMLRGSDGIPGGYGL